MDSPVEQETANGTVTPDRESTELTDDRAYHLLQNERRRNVLRYLDGTDGPIEMRDVAEQVAAWEHDTTVEALASDERQRVYIPLYQCHLPKLDEEEVVEYDQSRGVVERGALADDLNEYLAPPVETGDQDASARGRYFLGASGVSATLLVGTAAGVAPFAMLSTTTASVAVVAISWTLSLGTRFGFW